MLLIPAWLVGVVSVPTGALLVLVGAPLASLVVQLALSRSLEFAADRGAIELTGDPHGLASALERLNRPNDIICRSDGSIYFTDPQGLIDESLRELGASMLFRLRPDGTLESLLRHIPSINGLAFSPDERTFYVINTREPKLIEAFDADAAGDLSNRRTFIDMSADPADGNPDGMKVDVEGNVYCGGSGGIWVMDAAGKHLGIIAHGAPATTNMAWGGDDWKTLFFTTRDSLGRIPLKIAGLPVPSN